MSNQVFIGIDLGGTNVRAGLVSSSGLQRMAAQAIDSQGSEEKVLSQVYEVIRELGAEEISGIGIGVPSVVDTAEGIVYDVINIPSWKKVPLKALLEREFGVPAFVNNDANCFALAEHHFGKGRGTPAFIGLIVGTGMAAGVIIDGRLYEGRNCGAGEFGMIRYLDSYYEHYSSGQFFQRAYGISGKEAAILAREGDPAALDMWKAFGHHLGRAMETISLAYDPELVILGGSVGQALPLYEKWVWETLKEAPFQHSVQNLRIVASELEQPGLLGAAALAMV